MKTHGGAELKFHVFLTSTVWWGEWRASLSAHFATGEVTRIPSLFNTLTVIRTHSPGYKMN